MTKQKHTFATRYQQMKFDLPQSQMQNRFADVMLTYHKRNGAFIYN